MRKPDRIGEMIFGPDCSFILFRGRVYVFGTEERRAVIKVLRNAIISGVHFLDQPTIAHEAKLRAKDFRMARMFANHPAWRTLITSKSDGRFTIFGLNEPWPQPPAKRLSVHAIAANMPPTYRRDISP